MENNVQLHHHVFLMLNRIITPMYTNPLNFHCTDRFEADLNALAIKLHSRESLQPETTFTVDITVIETPPKGSRWKLNLVTTLET